MSDVNRVIGLILIALAFIIFVIALPAMTSAVQTGDGTALENETQTVKEVYNILPLFIVLIPVIMVLVGVGMLWKG